MFFFTGKATAVHQMTALALGAGMTPATFLTVMVFGLTARFLARVSVPLGRLAGAHFARLVVKVITLGAIELHISHRRFTHDFARALFGGLTPAYLGGR